MGSPDAGGVEISSPNTPLTPRFTWHGGQFVQVSAAGGLSFDGAKEALVGLVMHSNLTRTGRLEFSGGAAADALNGLQGIILNSQTSNVAAGTPTDCPTREKHGWLGDAQVTAEEAMQNFDMLSVYEVEHDCHGQLPFDWHRHQSARRMAHQTPCACRSSST